MGILIVDDSRFNLNTIHTMLDEKGYGPLYTVKSAKEALAFLDKADSYPGEGSVDLVLMDVVMPEMDGIEACQRIKNSEENQDLPIILMTADRDTKTLERAFKAGAMDFIHRPFPEVELAARIDVALALKGEMDVRKAREKELLEVMQDLADANQKLERLTLIDDLTGIANRRYFEAFSEQEWKRCLRERKPLSLIMIDIDYFKSYNDYYGHQKGDDGLKKVAETLNHTMNRAGDLAVRYGGEEFAAILSNTDPEGAFFVADIIRKEIEALQIEHPCSPIGDHVTVSLGLATRLPSHQTSFTDLIKAADQALYTAKLNGKNCVKVSPCTECQRYA